jgi:hypothetical protein
LSIFEQFEGRAYEMPFLTELAFFNAALLQTFRSSETIKLFVSPELIKCFSELLKDNFPASEPKCKESKFALQGLRGKSNLGLSHP